MQLFKALRYSLWDVNAQNSLSNIWHENKDGVKRQKENTYSKTIPVIEYDVYTHQLDQVLMQTVVVTLIPEVEECLIRHLDQPRTPA